MNPNARIKVANFIIDQLSYGYKTIIWKFIQDITIHNLTHDLICWCWKIKSTNIWLQFQMCSLIN